MKRTKCPICGSSADDFGDQDYGDKKRYDCIRCGQYEISGTASAMLKSRLSGDRLAPIRLSYALRSKGKLDDEWFMVLSTNIDELLGIQLPDIPHQVQILLTWLARKLGDERFGIRELPNLLSIAGLVGVVDQEQVKKLLHYMKANHLIEFSDSQISITAKGWDSINRPTRSQGVAAKKQRSRTDSGGRNQDQIVKANCSTCGRETNSFLRGKYAVKADDGVTEFREAIETLECCGCNSLSVRRTVWRSQWSDTSDRGIAENAPALSATEVTTWPPSYGRIPPDWLEDISDLYIRQAGDEVYRALNAGLIILATSGVRNLLDRAMYLHVGDVGGFAEKVKQMKAKELVRASDAEAIEILVDFGSATVHRGNMPNANALEKALSATESIFYDLFIRRRHLDEVAAATPPRHRSKP